MLLLLLLSSSLFFVSVCVWRQGGGDDDDEALRQARNHIGDFYRTRQKWDKAAQYYAQAENVDAHINVCFRLQAFKELQTISKNLPESDARLRTLGNYFQQCVLLFCLLFCSVVFDLSLIHI